MKDFAGGLVLFFIALFAYTRLAGPIPFSVSSTTTTTADVFTVTGEGKVSAAPDVAVVNAGVQAQGASVRVVQDELNKKINAVSAAIKSLGVDAKDIQTSGYNVNPNYDFRSGGQQITGYQASSNLTVKVRDIAKANGVIDAATAAGANQVGGITFDVDDKTKAENEAREEAVAEAKKKAENAARIAGFKLGRIINYSENFGGQPRPLLMMEAKAVGAPDQAPTQVEPGTSEIVVSVALSFEIR